MKINGVDRHRMASVHPDHPYKLHLLSNQLHVAECGRPIDWHDGWLVLVTRDDSPHVCDDCLLGKQLRRLSAHREVDAARIGDKLLHELRVAYRTRIRR